MHKIEQIHKTKIFTEETIKEKTPQSISPPCLSLSHANLSECEVCINEGGHLPIYTNQVIDLLHEWVQLLLERIQIHIT